MKFFRKLFAERFTIMIIITVIFVMCIMYIAHNAVTKKVVVTSNEILVDSNCCAYTNNIQFIANVWMDSYRNELYFYPYNISPARRTVYDGWLCVFRDQQVTKLFKIGTDNVRIVACANGYVYYTIYGIHKDSDDLLYCYDIIRDRAELLYSGRLSTLHMSSLSENKVLSVPFFSKNMDDMPKYLLLDCGKIIGTADSIEGYYIGDREYSVIENKGYLQESILVTDKYGNGEELHLRHANSRALIPVENGILIHNEGYNTLLYYISKDGDIEVLFNITGLCSYSSIAVIDADVYISVKRYEKFGSIGMLRYENDDVDGTYRINIVDSSVTKVSDRIYNGLYYFGGEQLYACDEYSNVYILDFIGSIVDNVLSVSR